MKKICLDLSESKALGDTLCSTPVLKKLCESYNSKITVITNYPELFKNNPLVEKVYHSDNINLEYLYFFKLYKLLLVFALSNSRLVISFCFI